LVRDIKPDFVVHAAAYTDVDGCESNPIRAYQVNSLGTYNVAEACRDSGCVLIYISTDFVFDGTLKRPYTEYDTPNPLSVYGCSKYRGECYVRQLLPGSYIVRAAWLFGGIKKDFVNSIITQSLEKTELAVIEDQIGSPTYSHDLADAIFRLIKDPRSSYGIWHITNGDFCTRYEFAVEIVKQAKLAGYPVKVKRIKKALSSTRKSIATRPKFAPLENLTWKIHGYPALPPWQNSLNTHVKTFLTTHLTRNG